ncbi:hypothetical protein D3C75_683270 [compost metagenome]
MAWQFIQITVLLLEPTAAQPTVIFRKRLNHFCERFTKDKLQMRWSIWRAADRFASKLQVTDAMFAEINNDVLALREIVLEEIFCAVHDIRSPTVNLLRIRLRANHRLGENIMVIEFRNEFLCFGQHMWMTNHL